MDDVMSSRTGNSVQTPEAAKHMIGCERCRNLMRFLNDAGRAPVPSESQLRRIRAGILENLEPVRPLPPSSIFLFACATIFLCVVAVGALLFGMNGWGVRNMVQRVAVFATLGCSAVLLAVSMVRQIVPGSKHALAPAALPIAVLAVLMLAIAATFRPQEESAFVGGGLPCLRNGLTYSIPAAFLFWLLLRRGAMLFPKPIGAAAGGLAGLIGLTVLEVSCPNLNVFHHLVWHGGVVLIGVLAGAALGAAVEYIEPWRNQTMF
jgi:hypothetical protein